MPKKPIEEIYRDSTIPDDMKLQDLIAQYGDDLSLADLRRAYKGYEKKIAEENQKFSEKEKQYQEIFQNAASRIQELESSYSDLVSRGVGANPAQPAADPLESLLSDPLAGELVRALTPKLSKLDDLEKALRERDQKFEALTKTIGTFGEALIMDSQRQAYNALPDRDPDVTFEQAYQEAQKNELYNDFYRQKDPNLRIPDVVKGYKKVSEPKRIEKMMAEAERRGREQALREARQQAFMPPPPSSALGNAGAGTAKNMDEAFRELSNDPDFNAFNFRI